MKVGTGDGGSEERHRHYHLFGACLTLTLPPLVFLSR